MSRSGTYRFIALLLAAFASAGMFSAQMSFAAETAAKAGKVEAMATQPAGKVTLSRETRASVKQLSQDLTRQIMSTRPGQEPLVHALPNAQQMQQSLEAYFHALVLKLLGGGGNGDSENGMCFYQQADYCMHPDTLLPGTGGSCVGQTKKDCGTIWSTCQRADLSGTYKVKTTCKWQSLP
jgi:hypothetical protein